MSAFLKDWGGLCIAVVSLGVSALAYWNSRRAVHITGTEHAWKEADRNEAKARREWCEEMCGVVAGAGGFDFEIPVEKIGWAKWGEENRYFRLAFDYQGQPVIQKLRSF